MGTGAESLTKGKVVVYRRLRLNPRISFEAPRQKSQVTPKGTVRTHEEKANMKCVFGSALMKVVSRSQTKGSW